MKKLTVEEQLFLLAYAGIPPGKIFKAHPELSDEFTKHIACIFVCAIIAIDSRRLHTFPHERVERYFPAKEMSIFFNTLVSSKTDDPRNIKLITALVQSFYEKTDSGMETYADFEPFTAFKHDAWLQLLIRIQKSDEVKPELKVAVGIFVAKGFSLILHPALNEYDDAPGFFPWFEKFEFADREELVIDALKTWAEYEEDENYNISEADNEAWYQAALEFAVRFTSKEHVSKVFAESFKETYPETYEKFRLLAGLDEWTIIATPEKDDLRTEELDEKQEMQKMFGRYTHEPDELVEILNTFNKSGSTEDLASVIFAISTNLADERFEHVRGVLLLLVEKYKDCELVKELSLVFTQNLEAKIENGTLEYSDVPPSPLYVNDPDWQWLF